MRVVYLHGRPFPGGGCQGGSLHLEKRLRPNWRGAHEDWSAEYHMSADKRVRIHQYGGKLYYQFLILPVTICSPAA